MRKLLTTFLLLGVIVSYGQKKSGEFAIYPRIGINYSKINNSNIEIYDPNGFGIGSLKSNFKFGIVAGAELQYQISSSYIASIGLLYSLQGTSYKDISSKTTPDKWIINGNKTILHFLNLPLLAIINFGFVGYSRFHFAVGLEPGWKIACQNQFTDIPNPLYSVPTKGRIIQEYKAMDLSIPIGIGIDFSTLCIDLRYNIGIINTNNLNKSHSKSQRIELIIGYRIAIVK